MSRIDDLIAALCPDGVEFKTLGDCITKNTGGGTPSRSNASYWDGDIPWASVGDLSISGNFIRTTRATITAVGFENSSTNLIKSGDVIVAVKISPGKMKIAATDLAINQDLRGLTLHAFIDSGFLTYYFQTIKIVGNGTIVKGITTDTLERIRIPVPPLEVQREIVKILDAFTELEAGLEAELETRQKQYQYYRDELLCFEGREDVRWATLREICQINRGRVMSKDYLRDNEGQYPVYSSQTANDGVFGYINSFDYDFESITWTTDGANAGSVFYHADEQFSITNVCGLLKVVDSSSLSTKFLYYILGVTAKRYVNEGMGNPKLMSNVMSQIKVPIPPIEEQVHIASILDKFDALVNDISSGLPAEIVARRKQYAYYRDRLLSFKEAA